MSSSSDLIDLYAAGAATVRKAVAGLTPEQLNARPVPGKWSILEVVAHLADFEPIFSDRIFRVITHERPLLLVADENLFHAALNPKGRDLEEELAMIDVTHKKITRILRSLPEEVFNRVGIHSFKGLVTLASIVSGATNHIDHHVKFIDEKRKALGL